MQLDISIVQSYLQGKEDYAEHWLFSHIADNGAYLFDKPDAAQREAVTEALEQTQAALQDFRPYNLELFSALFPDWRERIRDVRVILAVGCPAPYDAMVRAYDGREYIIYDLIRFLEYQKFGKDIPSLIRQLLTHEVSHVCLHADYPVVTAPYREKLGYIAFDEGFAHLLAFADGIEHCDFRAMLQAHQQDARDKLSAALSETDPRRQAEYLEASNSGPYWDKFAAISGKLYLASHFDRIREIYQNGPSAFLSELLS
jgi:hypothetical protein